MRRPGGRDSLDSVGLEDFRCIERAELALDDRCNVISGENASGKTSLLEAIFVLGRGRSFRTARTETLIRAEVSLMVLEGVKTERYNDAEGNFRIRQTN